MTDRPSITVTPKIRRKPTAGLTRRSLVHELQVHQVELEQQNEELLRVQGELVIARDRYINLFDTAPVTYLTLDRASRITEANLTAASEFATDRAAMLGRPFEHFVAAADCDRWHRVATRAFERKDLRRVELTMKREDGQYFDAQLECRAITGPASDGHLRLTLTEVSQRRLAAKNRRIAASGYEIRETERRAMALRLHEGLGQRLAALKLQLGALAEHAGADAGAQRAVVDKMATELDQALALVRRMSSDLHPLMLSDLGLRAALEWLVGDISARLGLRASLHFDEDDATLGQPLAIAIYRLVETALSHFAQYTQSGLSVELLPRPMDWVLVFQSTPEHARAKAPLGSVMALPHAFKDQIHLLNGRMEFRELPGRTHQLAVFIDRQAASAPAPPFADTVT
jgi:PAS domain S-box-containing protein